MRRHLVVPVLAIMAACLTVKTAPQIATAAVQGTVLNEFSKEPIRGVQITVRAGSLQLKQIDENLLNSLLNSGVGVGPGIANADALRVNIEQSAARAGSPTAKATTDHGGHFTIPDLSPGSYIVTAILDGYFAPGSNGSYSTVLQREVKVVAGQIADVGLTLLPSGTISGRVLDAMGMPAVDANVQILRISYQNGLPALQIAASKTTDDLGGYRLYQLMPGSYYVAVIPRQTKIGNGTPGGGNSNPSREMSVRTFFPRATEISQASPVTLRGGDENAGTNISIRTATGAKISGQVISSFPASDMIFNTQVGRGGVSSNPTATLTLLSHDKNIPQDPSSARNVSISMSLPTDGHFELSGIPPGLYDLYASLPDIKGYGPMAPPGQAGSPVAYGKTMIDLHGEDRTDVTVLVHHGCDINGTVTVDGDTSPSVKNVRVSLQPDDSSSNMQIYQQVSRFQPMVDSNGSFTIPVVPEAHYRFQVTFGPPLPQRTPMSDLESFLAASGVPTPDSSSVSAAATASAPPPLLSTAYVADILQGGVSVYDNGIAVGSASADPIQIIVKTNGGSIEGTVYNSKQIPFAGATVVLVPPTPHLQNPSMYKVTTSDAVGHFSISAVPPGVYRVFGWENVKSGAFQNEDFMRQYENRGVLVTVSDNSRVAAEVSLIQ